MLANYTRRHYKEFKQGFDEFHEENKNTENILIKHFGRSSDNVKTVYIGVNEKEYDPSKISESEKDKILEKYEINKKGKFTINFSAQIQLSRRVTPLVNHSVLAD